ncbi:MAG TPA: SPFH domain-containing protein [Aggregatilinea sp.]|jgi:flotillin|uniref:flotillin family protein n=1 Tax=Aggregatilinea sp. TaxID=2806333 RepID=UPI002BA7FF48|nr:SPFH domain-containing protein [Aggregatilinea sp.]HML21664.1 SPFH domain-containing protein [Aggregatilinea sp.]
MEALGAFVILLSLFVLFVLVAVYATRVRKVGPNEVLVISGRKRRNPETGEIEPYRIVKGGRAFIWPVLERVDTLSLELMTIEIVTDDVYTIQGVAITLEGVAQIKVASDDVSIRTAAERFLSKSRAEIINVAHETLAGHLRAIIGTLTVEQIYRERDVFAQSVQDVSASDLSNMGLGIDTFVIKDVRDKEGYLEALGRPRIAEVKRDATIAEQMARTREAESMRDYELQKAAYDNEVSRKRAEANLAGTLQENKTNQLVRAEQVQIEVIEKKKQIEVQEQEALRRERELEATVRKPAEARQYEIQTLASAEKFEIRARAEAEADAIRIKGEAEADAIRARGLAEAEAMKQKAAAWENYTQAALIQQIIDRLPEVASAVSAPLAKTERIVVISNGDGKGAGASKISGDIASIISQVPATVEALTGLNLIDALNRVPGMTAAAPAPNGSAEPAKPEEA